MNIAEFSIQNKVVTWVVTIVLVGVGAISFQNLSRLEDPEFTIKDAIIFTPYPGASATEVEEEVTNVIEKAAQEMGQLKQVESRSSRGMSYVKVTMKDKYDKSVLPQVWDELRRKVGDSARFLPPGAGPSLVNDDFGDVYGAYMAITGEGYTYKELYEYAKFLQRELLQVQDVKRVAILADRKEVVYVETRRAKMAELGVAPEEIYATLSAKNLVTPSGRAVVAISIVWCLVLLIQTMLKIMSFTQQFGQVLSLLFPATTCSLSKLTTDESDSVQCTRLPLTSAPIAISISL